MSEKESADGASTRKLVDATKNGGPSADMVESEDKPAASTDVVESDDKPAASTDVVQSGDESVGKRARRQLSISVYTLVVGSVIVALAVAVGVATWLYVGAERKLDAQALRTNDVARAEKLALDYATNAAAMNYQDLAGWKVKLVAGTSPELKDRLNKAAEQMEQILVPLQWNSTAQPLAAKVRSENGGVYDVDSFVSVQTKTAQGPDALQSTATYRITIDKAKGWQITDVGGIGAAMGGK